MYEYRAEILRVLDGDTVEADIDLGLGVWLRGQRIRLAHLNAPELPSPEGIVARDWLAREIGGALVSMVTHKNTGDREKYGRWLAEIFDGRGNVNDRAVAGGYAVRMG